MKQDWPQVKLLKQSGGYVYTIVLFLYMLKIFYNKTFKNYFFII